MNEKYSLGFPQYLGRIDIELGHQIIVLNDLHGNTLKDALLETNSARQLTVEELVEIIIKWLKLVQKIHKLGYNYNDIEPDNVFICEQTEIDDSKLDKTRIHKLIQRNFDDFLNRSNSGCKSYRIKKPSVGPARRYLLQKSTSKRIFEVITIISNL